MMDEIQNLKVACNYAEASGKGFEFKPIDLRSLLAEVERLLMERDAFSEAAQMRLGEALTKEQEKQEVIATCKLLEAENTRLRAALEAYRQSVADLLAKISKWGFSTAGQTLPTAIGDAILDWELEASRIEAALKGGE